MSKGLRRLFLFLIYAFLYAPILVLIVFSFNEGQTRGAWEGFSLHWYASVSYTHLTLPTTPYV